MRQFIAIFTCAVILLSSMSNALLVAEFKLNQAEIERLYCINKAKPEKHCHGKCHLTKQLAEKNNHQGQPNPTNQLEETLKINFFHQPNMLISGNMAEEKNQPIPIGTDFLKSRLFGKSMFQPPDPQPLA